MSPWRWSIVQEMCSRLGVYTGEGLGGLIREQFSAPSTFGALTLLLIANAGLTVSEFAGVGAAMEVFGRCSPVHGTRYPLSRDPSTVADHGSII